MNDSIVLSNADSGNPQRFSFNGYDFRIIYTVDGEPLFYATDGCKALGIANVSQAVENNVDPEDRFYLSDIGGICSTYTPNSKILVNESGLYSLILTSRKPEAKVFKRWITHEVLPALRKTGSYSRGLTPAEALLHSVERLVAHERQLAELERKQADQAQSIENITTRLEDAEYLTVLQFCQQQRLNVSVSVRQQWGKRAVEVSNDRGAAIKTTKEGLYMANVYHVSVLLAVCVPSPRKSNQLSLPRADE